MAKLKKAKHTGNFGEIGALPDADMRDYTDVKFQRFDTSSNGDYVEDAEFEDVSEPKSKPEPKSDVEIKQEFEETFDDMLEGKAGKLFDKMKTAQSEEDLGLGDDLEDDEDYGEGGSSAHDDYDQPGDNDTGGFFDDKEFDCEYLIRFVEQGWKWVNSRIYNWKIDITEVEDRYQELRRKGTRNLNDDEKEEFDQLLEVRDYVKSEKDRYMEKVPFADDHRNLMKDFVQHEINRAIKMGKISPMTLKIMFLGSLFVAPVIERWMDLSYIKENMPEMDYKYQRV